MRHWTDYPDDDEDDNEMMRVGDSREIRSNSITKQKRITIFLSDKNAISSNSVLGEKKR